MNTSDCDTFQIGKAALIIYPPKSKKKDKTIRKWLETFRKKEV